MIFHVEVNIEPAQAQQMFGEEDRAGRGVVWEAGLSSRRYAQRRAPRVPGVTGGAYPGAMPEDPPACRQPRARLGEINPATVVKAEQEKIGRNDPAGVPGKKYKKCHGSTSPGATTPDRLPGAMAARGGRGGGAHARGTGRSGAGRGQRSRP